VIKQGCKLHLHCFLHWSLRLPSNKRWQHMFPADHDFDVAMRTTPMRRRRLPTRQHWRA